MSSLEYKFIERRRGRGEEVFLIDLCSHFAWSQELKLSVLEAFFFLKERKCK